MVLIGHFAPVDITMTEPVPSVAMSDVRCPTWLRRPDARATAAPVWPVIVGQAVKTFPDGLAIVKVLSVAAVICCQIEYEPVAVEVAPVAELTTVKVVVPLVEATRNVPL